LRDGYTDLKNSGYEIVGVSADSEKSHQGFITKHNLPFRLISDTGKAVLKAYGAWGEKKMYGKTYEGIIRTTFVISGEGTIEKIIDKVITKDHANQIISI
jgi:peroxiredoxin Q/BCP